jgi:LPXTG-motif cell wall-anchored protein
LKKVMLLAAMLAMVLAAAVPALAQGADQAAVVAQEGNGNVACVQQAANVENNKVQINQYGDNINIQAIAQQCNITVAQVNAVMANVAGSAAPAAGQYQYQAAAAPAQYSASASASASASSAPAALPETGGSSLIALGAGVLLVAGGLLARRIVR